MRVRGGVRGRGSQENRSRDTRKVQERYWQGIGRAGQQFSDDSLLLFVLRAAEAV
jgi:hypothetical protein